MKTLKDLKEVIALNGGELAIGALSFSYSGSGDVDIRIDDGENSLLGWIDSDVNDGAELSNTPMTVSSDIRNGRAALKEQNSDKALLNEAKTEIDMLKKKIRDCESKSVLDSGKVEAYEKILMGRNLTVSA